MSSGEPQPNEVTVTFHWNDGIVIEHWSPERWLEYRAALTDLAQARTELAAIKERTCETCKHGHRDGLGDWLECLKQRDANTPMAVRVVQLPDGDVCSSPLYVLRHHSCAAHERRAQSAVGEMGETDDPTG